MLAPMTSFNAPHSHSYFSLYCVQINSAAKQVSSPAGTCGYCLGADVHKHNNRRSLARNS